MLARQLPWFLLLHWCTSVLFTSVTIHNRQMTSLTLPWHWPGLHPWMKMLYQACALKNRLLWMEGREEKECNFFRLSPTHFEEMKRNLQSRLLTSFKSNWGQWFFFLPLYLLGEIPFQTRKVNFGFKIAAWKHFLSDLLFWNKHCSWTTFKQL